MGIGSQIGGLATPNPNANGSPNIKRTFEELQDCIRQKTDEFLPEGFELENSLVFSELKASAKKLRVVQEIIEGINANVANVKACQDVNKRFE